MRLCFIVEDRYRGDSMPLAVARRLIEWGHEIHLFHPQADLADVTDVAVAHAAFDAWILKTDSTGPGLSILEAVAAAGATTINDARHIRAVRNKTVTAATARSHGLPFPMTYFAAEPGVLRQIPDSLYPLVVKPANGSACRDVHLVRTPRDLESVQPALARQGFLNAQPYLTNPGVDLKAYFTGDEIFATEQRSPLHPTSAPAGLLRRVPAEVNELVERVGDVFHLDLFGVDLLQTPAGWMVVDINDFPSFHFIPDAVARVARTILRIAAQGRRNAAAPPSTPLELVRLPSFQGLDEVASS